MLLNRRSTDTKVVQILTVDLALIGIIIAQGQEFASIVGVYIAFSVVSFLVSIFYCVVSYLPTKFGWGPEPADIKKKSKNSDNTHEYHRFKINEYLRVYSENRRISARRARYMEKGMWAALNGLLIIAGSSIPIAVPFGYNPIYDIISVLIITLIVFATRDTIDELRENKS